MSYLKLFENPALKKESQSGDEMVVVGQMEEPSWSEAPHGVWFIVLTSASSYFDRCGETN